MTSIISIPGFSEPFSSLSHFVMAAIFLISWIILIVKAKGNLTRIVGISIYCFCAVYLFSMSGVYHLLEKGSTASYILQILDHTGIFAMIAGTFTPIHLILFRGPNRWLVLLIVWTLSITGLTMTAIFFSDMSEALLLTFFLGLGWMGLISMYRIYHLKVNSLLYLLVAGGLCYSIGAVVDFLRGPVFIPGVLHAHEFFHIMVNAGAILHLMIVYKVAKLPISQKIKFNVTKYSDGKVIASATSEAIHLTSASVKELKDKIHQWIEDNYMWFNRPKEIVLDIKEREKIEVN